jgi:hypothetical protein
LFEQGQKTAVNVRGVADIKWPPMQAGFKARKVEGQFGLVQALADLDGVDSPDTAWFQASWCLIEEIDAKPVAQCFQAP